LASPFLNSRRMSPEGLSAVRSDAPFPDI